MPTVHATLLPGATAALITLERALADVGTALREQDVAGVNLHGATLQRELARLAEPLAQGLRHSTDPALRTRVAHLYAQAGAQRQAVARALAAQQRALEILLPVPPPAQLYSSLGGTAALPRRGLLLA